MNTTLQYIRFAAQRRRQTGQPFWIGSGARKPHAPWETTQAMWDLYNNVTIETAVNNVFSNNTPLIAWSKQLDLRLANGTVYNYGPFSPAPQWVQQDQRRAYYSSTSFVDSNIGQILSVLEEEGLANETIVVVMADHGYLLGSYSYCTLTREEGGRSRREIVSLS